MVTVQPRERSVSIAASPVDEGADPPDWLNTRVPVAMPDVTIETRMLSMLVCVSAVLLNALEKSPPFILSKALAGKFVRLSQLYQANAKLVPEDVSMSGKLVRLLHSRQAKLKLVPEDVSMSGKLVRLSQSHQASSKLVPDEVLIKGKEVSSNQPRQKLPKSVTAP